MGRLLIFLTLPATVFFPLFALAQTQTNRVKVNILQGTTLTVRSTPAGDRVGTQPNGAEGAKVGESQQANGRLWQQVDFDPQGQDQKDGWVAASLIVPINSSSPTPTPTPTPTGSIQRGARVEVSTEPGIMLTVRDAAGGNRVGSQARGAKGTIQDGPQITSSYTWWKVDFDFSTDGWVAGKYLVVVHP